jgi:hypothetical protein
MDLQKALEITHKKQNLGLHQKITELITQIQANTARLSINSETRFLANPFLIRF